MTDPARRTYVPVRLSPSALDEVQQLADREHAGNRSAALRQLLRLGLAAYRSGRR
jgi:metal-responsive CopG/Arc/MetJ family transcriptional regulator